MTAIFSNGFESGDLSAWTSTLTSGATISVTSTLAHSVSYSCRMTGLTVAGYYAMARKSITATAGPVYERAYIRFIADFGLNTNVTDLLHFDNGTSRFVAGLERQADGTYRWLLQNTLSGLVYYSSSFSLSLNSWYCLELEVAVSASAGVMKLWVNGDLTISETNINTGTTNLSEVRVEVWQAMGNANAGTVYFDDVVVSDSYIGPMTMSVLLSDSLSLADDALRSKPCVLIADNVDAADLTLNDKLLQALDSIGASDAAFISKVLVVDENVCLFEVVEQDIAGARTRLFLILGDLAIQLTGN